MSARGFTLLETMVALVILGLVATASLELFGSALRSARSAEEWTTASAYAEEGMELAKLDLRGAVARGAEMLEGGFERRITWRVGGGGVGRVTVAVALPDGSVFEVDRLVPDRLVSEP